MWWSDAGNLRLGGTFVDEERRYGAAFRGLANVKRAEFGRRMENRIQESKPRDGLYGSIGVHGQGKNLGKGLPRVHSTVSACDARLTKQVKARGLDPSLKHF